MKKKMVIILVLSIIGLIISTSGITLFIINNKDKQSNKEINKVEKNTNEVIKKEDNEGKKLVKELLNDNNFNKIDINDEALIKKYNALKTSLIYSKNVESLDKEEKNLIFNAIGYDITNDNITETSNNDNYTYGYIKKSVLDNKIKELFGPINIRITNDKSSDYISVSYGRLDNADQKYRNATLMETNGDNYLFRFYGAEGTWAAPVLSPVPIKLVEAREYNNYVLIVSKAVYDSPIDLEDNQWKVKVCSNKKCDKVIEEIKVNEGRYYSLNIDNYIDKVGTIYTIFKKDNNNYYYYKNIIDE